MTSRLRRLPALLVPLVLLLGCSPGAGAPPVTAAPSSSVLLPPPPSAPSAPADDLVQVTIEGFAFRLPPSVPAGSVLAIENRDPLTHVFVVDARREGMVVVPAGETVAFRAPSSPGSYPVTCGIHGSMSAVLVVS